jgi:hypothetical protein
MRSPSPLLAVIAAMSVCIASCAGTERAETGIARFSLPETSFVMRLVPAMDFPGGPLGISLLSEPRPEIIGVKEAYWLAETNTSYALWAEVRDWAKAHGYRFAREGQMGTEKGGVGMTPEHPVTVVDWPSAIAWCNALTEMLNEATGARLEPVYRKGSEVLRDATDRDAADASVMKPGSNGFRLPTGLEWELAARYASSNPEGDYVEYPSGSGRYWAPFIQVSGELEGKPGATGTTKGIGAELGNVVSIPVYETRPNDLGFYGFAGPEGKLWQWCSEFLMNDGRDSFYLKRGGSRGPRCGRHDNWPKTKWGPTCMGFDQITFRVARSAP